MPYRVAVAVRERAAEAEREAGRGGGMAGCGVRKVRKSESAKNRTAQKYVIDCTRPFGGGGGGPGASHGHKCDHHTPESEQCLKHGCMQCLGETKA